MRIRGAFRRLVVKTASQCFNWRYLGISASSIRRFSDPPVVKREALCRAGLLLSTSCGSSSLTLNFFSHIVVSPNKGSSKGGCHEAAGSNPVLIFAVLRNRCRYPGGSSPALSESTHSIDHFNSCRGWRRCQRQAFGRCPNEKCR